MVNWLIYLHKIYNVFLDNAKQFAGPFSRRIPAPPRTIHLVHEWITIRIWNLLYELVNRDEHNKKFE